MNDQEPDAPDYYYDWINTSNLTWKQRLQVRVMIGYLVARGFSEWGTADSPESEGSFLLVLSRQARFTIDFAEWPTKLVLNLGEGLGTDFTVVVDANSIHDSYESLKKILP